MPKGIKAKAAAVRASLLESLSRDVTYLLERDRFTALEHVMMGTGYVDNGAASTSEDFAAAILALAKILPLFWLRSAAVQAAFERSYLRPNLDEPQDELEGDAYEQRWRVASRRVLEVMGAAKCSVMQAAGRAA